MSQLLVCLLTLLFSLSSPAMEGHAVFWQSSLAAEGGAARLREWREPDNTLVHEISRAYSADHHNVTITNGSGANAIVSTEYTDNDGRPVLSVEYPTTGNGSVIEHAWR